MTRPLPMAALAALLLLTPAPPAAAAPARKVVMIDPGHGGTNRGALGKKIETYEKKLTLKLSRLVALEVKKLRPRWRVLLTRKDDRYLTLDQRVRMANKARADLFISLHLNASPGQDQRGFETFILSRQASDDEAARVAAEENGAPAVAGKAARPRVVGQILGDLRQSAALAGSLALAKGIQRELRVARGEALDRGVKQAPFDVLLGLRMPGVLVEAGFIDNAQEGPQMTTPKVQRAVARAVARALVAQLKDRVRGKAP